MDHFDKWTELKKLIAQEVDDPTKFPKEGEVGCVVLVKILALSRMAVERAFRDQ